MRVLYIANHGCGGNQDEDAITWALRQLGHEVEPLREHKGHMHHRLPRCDLLLFHKWDDWETLRKIKIPKVFWYFDLVEFPEDPSLGKRDETRRQWMERTIPLVDLGFCTDGDWVDKHPKKLVWLTQGADSRFTGFGNPYSCPTCKQRWKGGDVLFTGTRVGDDRIRQLDELAARYKDRFLIAKGVHQRCLADLIASCKVVIAPESPCTDKYWSNRVYNTLGFGGFLIHPRCLRLERHYVDKQHLVMYDGQDELFRLIDSYLDFPSARQEIAERGYLHTLEHHTYTARCQQLLSTVKERLSL